MLRHDCHSRLNAVKRSYETALKTLAAFISLSEANPNYLEENNLTLREIRDLAFELHDVYFARPFASFENSLRNYWRNGVRDSKPLTKILIASLAARRGVEQNMLEEVQDIRDFRNSITHDEHEPVRRFTIDEAIGLLNTFLARLPFRWD